MKKYCPACGKTKLVELFYKDSSDTSHRAARHCKTCEAFDHKDLPQNKELKRYLTKSNRIANYNSKLRKRLLSFNNSYARKKRNVSNELTEDDLIELWLRQDGECAICGKEMLFSESRVDHNHETGGLRGLLCDQCNLGIGSLRENAIILANAIAYLDYYRL